MKLIRAEDHAVMPWRNGGGSTREVAAGGDEARPGEFLWRVSIASVDRPGPFSRFDGIDRTIAVMTGGGLRLSRGSPPEELCLLTSSQPFSFRGEDAVYATPVDGETSDINVMTRRGACAHTMDRRRITGTVDVEVSGDESFIVFNDPFLVQTPGGRHRVGPMDALRGTSLDSTVRLVSPHGGEIFVIQIRRLDPA